MSWVKFGKITGVHGLKGELELKIFSDEKSLLNPKYQYNIQKDQLIRPVTLVSFRWKSEIALLTFEGISDRTAAEKLKGFELLIQEKYLQSQPGDTPFLRELLGFQVADAAGTKTGVVSNFRSNGPQDLLVVTSADGEFEIPFVDALILKVDWAQKLIQMDIPAGLMEVNLKKDSSKPTKK